MCGRGVTQSRESVHNSVNELRVVRCLFRIQEEDSFLQYNVWGPSSHIICVPHFHVPHTCTQDPNAHSAFPVALLPPLEAKGRSVTQQQSPVRVGGVGGGVLGHPREVQQRAAVRDLQV